MNPQQWLEQLQGLAAIEHALIVDHLQIGCALGTDNGIDTPLGPPSAEGVEAAAAAEALATGDMRHFRALNGLVVAAGLAPVMRRASSIEPASGPPLALGAVTPATFATLADRQRAIATAVEARYAFLERALPTVDPPLPAEVTDQAGFVLTVAAGHADRMAGLAGHFGTSPPAGHLRATRAEPATDAERRLTALSDAYYQALLALLTAWFAHDDELGGDLFGRAVAAMTELDGFNDLLVTRGLIPRFGP